MVKPEIVSDEEREIRKAYGEFLAAKYPGMDARDKDFGYFDPHDNVPDKGMVFLKHNRELMLTDRTKIGPALTLRVLLGAQRKPPSPGWYIAIGPGWMYMGRTATETVELFRTATAQLKRAI